MLFFFCFLHKGITNSGCHISKQKHKTFDKNKKRTLFYLLDGARPDILNELIAGGKLPNLKRIVDEGTFAKEGKSLLYTRAHFAKRHHPVDIQGHERIMKLLHSGKDFDFLFAVFPSVDWDSHYPKRKQGNAGMSKWLPYVALFTKD